MLMPKDFKEVQGYTGFETLNAGGHICKIMKVEETKTKNGGKDMIVVYLDTDKTDSQPEFYSNQFKNNTNPDKKWSNNAISRVLVFDAEGNTNRSFKTFIECVESSNAGFNVVWGDKFCDCLKGKLVGGVFGREEYLDRNTGESRFAVRFQNFRTVDQIKNGVTAPKDKLLEPSSAFNANEDITPVDDGVLPF